MYTTANFAKELSEIEEHYSPKIVGQVNDQYVKVAKLFGELTWHKHDEEDEMFIIVNGEQTIEYENGAVDLTPGDFHIVPKNTFHNPVAKEECWIVLIEPVETKHTGGVETERTKSIEEQLG